MVRVVPYVMGGIAAVLPLNYLPLLSGSAGQRAELRAPAQPVTNAARKGDRSAILAATAASEEIATIEVVGLREPAIIYRARDGRELFRTDPVSNVTIISKGLLLPEVTVRERGGAAVKTAPIEPPREQANDRKPLPASLRVPVGCEPLFSPLTLHPSVTQQTGRCMAKAEGKIKLSEARR